MTLRSVRPIARATPISVSFKLPVNQPLSNEPSVAVLDGGLPSQHVLSPYVSNYFKSDDTAQDVVSYLDHGLGVTSALLFGPVEPGQEAQRPYSYVDHYRVLDELSDGEDPYELYRTLGHVEEVMLSRQYQFINLSLGPDRPIEDDDVHAWTAVIDTLLSDGETLMTVAVGNNGERDQELGFDRVQVPADCVNALSVGASNRTDKNWSRAPYSARGPGRNPGRRKPDIVAFGGSPKEYFHVAVPGRRPELSATMGTSFAAPYALRTAVGIRAVLGESVAPLTVKALIVHAAESPELEASADPLDIGWGRVPQDLNDIIMCGDGMARIIYQGVLRPGKFLRAPVPLPPVRLQGKVQLHATFCYASPVDVQDTGAYTKAGLSVTFRPHAGKKKPGKEPAPKSFFSTTEFRTEQEQRNDLGKWETVLDACHTFMGSSLEGATFDIHYNARDGGATPNAGAELVRYALVLTVIAPKHANLYDEILSSHSVLKAIEPKVSVPLQA
jgi:Subtilase family